MANRSVAQLRSLSMNGTTNIKVPADAPVFFAGVPLEIEVQGKGVARLNTLEVDPLWATARFTSKCPSFDVNANAFGQKALLELRDGHHALLLNGKPLADGPTTKTRTRTKTPAQTLRSGDRQRRAHPRASKNSMRPNRSSPQPKAPRRTRAHVAVEPVKPVEDAIDKGAFHDFGDFARAADAVAAKERRSRRKPGKPRLPLPPASGARWRPSLPMPRRFPSGR